MRSLIGLLMPVLMGVLGRQQQVAGRGGAELARQLRSEAGDFRAAMPSGLSSMLDSSGFFDQVGAPEVAAADRTTREGAATEQVTRLPHTPAPRAEPARSSTWAYWALPLAAIVGGLIGYMFGGDQREVDTTTAFRTPDVSSARPLSSYLRQPVVSQTGEPLGTVENMLVTQDGQAMAVLSTAQPLGLGERRVAVPMSSLQATSRDGGTQLVFRGSRDALSEAPSVGPSTGGGTTGAAPTTLGTTGTTTTQPPQQGSPSIAPSPQGTPAPRNQ